MPYRKTQFKSGCYYHLYNRGNNRHNIFFERENYLYFLRQIRRFLIPQTLDVIAYCLMPNHYHLVVYLKSSSLSDAMQAFSLSYTKAINKRYHRTGSLFQGRFQSVVVAQENYLLQLVYYVHQNPVKAGFVNHPRDWEFSSYQDYARLRQGTLPKINVLRQLFYSNDEYQAQEPTMAMIQHLIFDE
ncbi:REP-associated tyrosine transposase [Coleofasciculus sp. F4-SAH-05]|uniref:REP-associated tyrosine transposase n=1 Tax=Coleofasciculus sp. F4-SAH-05 TaxID=3069525 RepID=UPI00330421C8